METINIVLKLVGFIIIALGVVFIYDARDISKNRFSYSDRNNSTKILKIVGFVISIIGAVIVILNIQ